MDNDKVYNLIREVNEDPNNDRILLSWHKDDVHHRAKELLELEESPLTDEQARSILKAVEKNHDCTIGVTWESFDRGVEDYFPNWCVKRPIENCTLNGFEFLLDSDNKIMTFSNIGQAEDFLGKNMVPYDSVEIVRFLGDDYEY